MKSVLPLPKKSLRIAPVKKPERSHLNRIHFMMRAACSAALSSLEAIYEV